MALNRKSRVKDIIANEQALAMLKKHMPSFDEHDTRLAPAFSMPIQSLLSFPTVKVSVPERTAFYEELEAANIE